MKKPKRTRWNEKYKKLYPTVEITEPEDIVDVFNFLCTNKSSFFNGYIVAINDGLI